MLDKVLMNYSIMAVDD